jgi:hypothetical protein
MDIYKLFGVKKIDKNSDKYIEAMLDLENFTDGVNNQKINLSIKSNSLKPKENPTTTDAKKSRKKELEQQERNEKIGIGQELKIAYKFAKQIKDKESFIKIIKNDIYKNDEALKDDKNLTEYLKNIDNYNDANNLTFAENVIQIASHKLDGLGYDLIIPDFNNDNKIIGIKKVELKTTTRLDNIEIHFSRNEIERILHYMEVDNWEIWLNNEENNITKEVKEAVKQLEEKTKDINFIFTDYILTLGTNQ